MGSDFLSDIELYYSGLPVSDGVIRIEEDERHHIIDVMRHKTGDEIYVTDGSGSIYTASIQSVQKKYVEAIITKTRQYRNEYPNIYFCIPRLKSAERFEFALEKCVEFGITNFIVFDSSHTVAKGEKVERWQKILTGGMKQSLRAWLPNVRYVKDILHIIKLDGTKYFFDQNASHSFQGILTSKFTADNFYFIFGPEGGFSEDEMELVPDDFKIKLTGNRLRSETAIISAAVILSSAKL